MDEEKKALLTGTELKSAAAAAAAATTLVAHDLTKTKKLIVLVEIVEKRGLIRKWQFQR